MSVQTLYTAATGMQAMETKLDVIANNLANVNTTGFKKGRANFEDLFYRHEAMPGADPAGGGLAATGKSIGLGTRVSSIQTNFQQGAFEQTGSRYDVAIEGPGFFQVEDVASGTNLYTRSGNFSVNANGQLVLGSATAGRVVQSQVTIPPNVLDVAIQADGNVLVRLPGQEQPQSVGQIQLSNFVNPEGLLKLGENLYQETEASGQANLGIPGDTGLGVLQQGALEASNVEPVQELIDLITTQRSFELNSQAVQAGDQVL
ncbi:MAG: flagellar basal-body rod protein FlgG, partial [Pirellulaceae bacterium]